MKAISFVLYALSASFFIFSIVFGYVGIGILSVCLFLFGLAFYTLSDLERQVAQRLTTQPHPSGARRTAPVLPIGLFVGALVGIVAGLAGCDRAFFGMALYFTLFGVLFLRLSLLREKVTSLTDYLRNQSDKLA
jgi:hypothetical protein